LGEKKKVGKPELEGGKRMGDQASVALQLTIIGRKGRGAPYIGEARKGREFGVGSNKPGRIRDVVVGFYSRRGAWGSSQREFVEEQ